MSRQSEKRGMGRGGAAGVFRMDLRRWCRGGSVRLCVYVWGSPGSRLSCQVGLEGHAGVRQGAQL